jgi:hypothetical protein
MNVNDPCCFWMLVPKAEKRSMVTLYCFLQLSSNFLHTVSLGTRTISHHKKPQRIDLSRLF